MALAATGAGRTTQGEEVSIDLMANLDFSSIDEMDPSLVDGFRVIYDREASLEVRVQESYDGPQQIGTLEAFKVKILLLGDDENPQAVRVELTSEADLFFHYMHELDEHGFAMMQEQQRLMVDFKHFANVLIKVLNSCITDPMAHMAIFVLLPDSTGRVEFIQNLEYKFVDVMALSFSKSAEDIVQQHITYRYNALKGRLALLQARLQDVSTLLKHKNPSLLLQLQKSPTIALVNSATQAPPPHFKATATSTRRAGEV